MGIAVLLWRPGRPQRDGIRLGATAGSFDVLANALFLVASRQGLVTLIGVIGSMYPASTVVLARLVLRERMAAHQLVGTGPGRRGRHRHRGGLSTGGSAQGRPLNRCMAASTPWPTMHSTASAASATITSSSSRRRLGTFDSTWSAPRSGPPGGLPTPRRMRT